MVRLPPMVVVAERSRPMLISPPSRVTPLTTENEPVKSLATLKCPNGPRSIPRLTVNWARFPLISIRAADSSESN